MSKIHRATLGRGAVRTRSACCYLAVRSAWLGHAVARGLALTVGATACAGTDGAIELGASSQAVLGGEPASDCDWPSVVSLGGCSGVFVHPRLVVYAAHCGNGMPEIRFGPNAERPMFVVATDRCHTMPGAGLGNGTDLAYCVLEDAVTEIEPSRVLAGCEIEALAEGAAVTMVGFGADGPEGEYGTQRVGSSSIAEVGVDLLLASEGVDTCLGDSGGPLFLDVEEPDGTVSPRVVGITSAGTEEDCGEGVSHYVNLAEQIAWLEQSSGLDVTPCFDGDTWSPTPDCVSVTGMEIDGGAEDELACRRADEPRLLTTCGDAFAANPDEDAPWLELTSPAGGDIEHLLGPDEDFVELQVSAEAEDAGWGVREVRFSLFDAEDELKLRRLDQSPPYGIPVLRIPEGSFTLITKATDYAGNSATEGISIDVTRPEPDEPATPDGCQLAAGPGNGQPGWLLVAVGCSLLRFGRRGRGQTNRARDRHILRFAGPM